MFAAVPFLLVPLGVYGVLVLVAGPSILSTPLLAGTLPSGVPLTFDVGMGLIALSLLILLIEMCKVASRNFFGSIFNPLISALLVGGGAYAFMTLPQAGTTTFLVLLMAGVVDVFAGFVVWLRHFGQRTQPA